MVISNASRQITTSFTPIDRERVLISDKAPNVDMSPIAFSPCQINFASQSFHTQFGFTAGSQAHR
jgi:hypothetical protein